MVTEKEGSIGVFQRLPFYQGRMTELLGAPGHSAAQETDPVLQFKRDFIAKYKLADMFMQNASKNLQVSEEEFKGEQAAAAEANSDDDEVEMAVEGDEDTVAKSEPRFPEWQRNL